MGAQKAVVALVVAAIAIAGYFVAFDPGFNDAAILVVVGIFNVVGVFQAKNHTADDVSKAVQALSASTLGLVGLFVTVDPGTVETVGGIVLALLNVYGVFATTNDPAPA